MYSYSVSPAWVIFWGQFFFWLLEAAVFAAVAVAGLRVAIRGAKKIDSLRRRREADALRRIGLVPPPWNQEVTRR